MSSTDERVGDEVARHDGQLPAESGDMRASPLWDPYTIEDIQAKSRLGRYRITGFSLHRRIPRFDDLVLLPAAMTRLPLEGYRERCETRTVLGARSGCTAPLELEIPIYITSMSFGALSWNAKAALGRAASRVGTCTCTGEGGMLTEERAESRLLIYQMTPSRYLLDLDHLRQSDAIEIAVGQGAKPGTGGVLLGAKVADRVAEMRTLPKGIDQRSAVRHPDFLGADDMQVKLEELRIATDNRIPFFVKMGACRVREDVKIAAKAGADVIVVDGMEGATGASPEILLDNTGIPTLAAVTAAREALEDLGLLGEVNLVVSGGIRNGADAAKAIALGADAVAIGTAALIALDCNAPKYVEDYKALGTAPGHCHHCHTGKCPVGITTQDPDLVERLEVDAAADRVENFLNAMVMEMTLLAKACGKGNVHNLEPEDLRALTVEAAAMARVPLAGTDWIPGHSSGP
jgi:methylamine---glutamate N-methyltransferase subunit C